jgi:hypothetical protein
MMATPTREQIIAHYQEQGMSAPDATAKADRYLAARGAPAAPKAEASKPTTPKPPAGKASPKSSTSNPKPAAVKAPEPPKPGPVVKAHVPTMKEPVQDGRIHTQWRDEGDLQDEANQFGRPVVSDYDKHLTVYPSRPIVPTDRGYSGMADRVIADYQKPPTPREQLDADMAESYRKYDTIGVGPLADTARAFARYAVGTARDYLTPDDTAPVVSSRPPPGFGDHLADVGAPPTPKRSPAADAALTALRAAKIDGVDDPTLTDDEIVKAAERLAKRKGGS